MNSDMVAHITRRRRKPGIYSGTSVPMKAKSITKNGIFPGLYLRPPWFDSDNNCDCGRGAALTALHARWCDIRTTGR